MPCSAYLTFHPMSKTGLRPSLMLGFVLDREAVWTEVLEGEVLCGHGPRARESDGDSRLEVWVTYHCSVALSQDSSSR